MIRDQSPPTQWLIVNHPMTSELWTAVRRLSPGTGLLILEPLSARELRRMRTLARLRRLRIVFETPQTAVRVHDVRELRRALFRRTRLVFLSPIYPTSSHPNWQPIRRMRAAALARLGHRSLVALGGMNRRRYGAVAPLGFTGWAGISAFRT